mmetsp:Transcript_9070/g.14757  ORF Transcript_9070/g.14757 Transcript_9070/m.14757 type:complete len:91 (+) Transcript_9070:232-504(+)
MLALDNQTSTKKAINGTFRSRKLLRLKELQVDVGLLVTIGMRRSLRFFCSLVASQGSSNETYQLHSTKISPSLEGRRTCHASFRILATRD